MLGETHYCLDATLVPEGTKIQLYTFPKARVESFALPRKALPSVTLTGPMSARDVLNAVHATLKAPLTSKQLRCFRACLRARARATVLRLRLRARTPPPAAASPPLPHRHAQPRRRSRRSRRAAGWTSSPTGSALTVRARRRRRRRRHLCCPPPVRVRSPQRAPANL